MSEFRSEGWYQDMYADPEDPDGEENETMAETKVGSGLTTQKILRELRRTSVAGLKAHLASISGGRVGLKPKQVELLVEGFQSGFLEALRHLEAMGVISVAEDAASVSSLPREDKS